MADPTETPDLMDTENESEKVNPDQERALAGQGGPLPQEFLFDGPGGGDGSAAPDTSSPSDSTRRSEVEGVVEAGMGEEERVHTARRKPFNKTLATVLMIGGVVGFIIVIFFNFGNRDSQVAEEEVEAPEEEVVFRDDSAQLRSQLALQDQRTLLDELEAQETGLVVEEPEEVEEPSAPELSPPPAQPVSSSPPRPAPPPPRPTPAPPLQALPPAPPAPDPVDPFDRWAQLSRLGTERAGEDQIEGSNAAAAPDVFAQAAAAGSQGASSPFQSVAIGGGGSNGGAPAQQGRVQVQAQPQPQLESRSKPQPQPQHFVQASRPSGESALVAATPGSQGILDWHQQRQRQPQAAAPVQPELGTQVQARVVTPMAWDLALGSNQSPDLGAGRFVIELTQDLTDQRGRVALPRGANLVVQASTVSPDNQLVQASAIAVVYQSRGQSIQQAIPEGALLVQGQGARPLVAQRLNDLGPNLFAEDLLVGTLSALGRAGAVLNQPREEFSSAATGDSTSSTVARTTRAPNLLGGVLEGFGDTISGRIQTRSDQNLQAQIDANTVAILPEGMTVTLVVNSFLEVSP